MSRRKGTPCACSDDCGCSSSRGKCITAVNNISPDPNGDFNIKAGTGIAISDGPDNEITIINSANPNAFVEGDNIDLIPSGNDIEIALTQDPVINGTLTVNGDIIQNGAAYETHAEHIYSRDDYIIMRDGAIAALAPGDYAGFQVKLYDGVNDGRLVIDSSGTARVGDVGNEQPLLTRDESADLTDHDFLVWDTTNQKAVTSGIPFMNIRFPVANADVQTVTAGTVTKVNVTENDTNDTANTFFTFSSTDHEITINRTGYYRINYSIRGLLSAPSRVEAACGDQNDSEKYSMITYSDFTSGAICIAGENIAKFTQGDKIFLSAWINAGTMTLNSHRQSMHLNVQYLG